MRTTPALCILTALLALATLMTLHQAVAEPAWTIGDHVVIEGQDLELERNISVVDGGWLEVLGSTLRFNCSQPLEYGLFIGPGGRLTIAPSANGDLPQVAPVDPANPTRISSSWSGSVDIRGLEMTTCGWRVVPALLVDHAGAVLVRDCDFRDCRIALSIGYCTGVKVEGNHFHNSNITAVELTCIFDSAIVDNVFDGCNACIELGSSTSVLLKGNDLGEVKMFGLNLGYVDDVLVTSTSVHAQSGHAVEVWMCKLLAIEGMTATGDASGLWPAVGIEVTGSSFLRVQGCELSGFKEGVVVSAIFADRDDSNRMSGVNITDCDIAVNITSNANVVTGCAIARCRIGVSIGPIYGTPSTGNRIEGCTITQCEVGVLVASSRRTSLEGSTLTGCGTGVSGQDATENVMSRCSLLGTDGSAVAMVRGTITLRDCASRGGSAAISLASGSNAVAWQTTIETAGLSADLEGGSYLELHNSTHARAYDISPDSEMRILWDVEVEIRFESGARPTVPGSLTVRDTRGTVVLDRQIPDLPISIRMEAMESRYSKGAFDVRTPHAFLASAMDRSRAAEATVDRFTRIAMTIDDVPPRIVVKSPTSSSTRDGHVSLRGSCVDNSSTDVAIGIALDGKPLFAGENLWDMAIELGDGPHIIEYNATDSSDNRLKRRQQIMVDSTPPTLEVLSPPRNPYLTSDDAVVVTGRVVDGTGLSIDGNPLSMDKGSFTIVLPLDDDDEYSWVLATWDDLGNEANVTLRVTRDTTPPLLELDGYPLVTRDSPVTIGGTTDIDVALLQLDGRDVPWLPGGRFSLTLDLAEGPNGFMLAAADATGNRNGFEIEIALDTRAIFEIVWPSNGTRVQSSDVIVVVRGETGARYRIGQGGWSDADGAGYCSIPITLLDPENLVTVTMIDNIGNTGDKSVVVLFVPRVVYREQASIAWLLVLALVIVIGSVALLILHLRTARMQVDGESRPPAPSR